ncbi:ArsR/SmtB family transcription factor, partial [Halalkalibacterium halodurans]
LLYVNEKHEKRFDLGPAWKKSIMKTLPEPFHPLLTKPNMVETLRWLDHHILFDQTAMTGESVEDLLIWVKEQHDLCTSFPYSPHVQYEPKESSEQLYTVLSGWHEHYYSKIDCRIEEGLIHSQAFVEENLKKGMPEKVIDDATNGIWLEEQPDSLTVHLIPQYHWRPLVLYTHLVDVFYYGYAVDAIPAEEESFSPLYLRTQQALSDSNRLKVLQFIAREPKPFKEIHKHLGLAKSTVHHHLITLRAAGLVRVHVHPEKPDRYSFRREGLIQLEGRLLSIIEGSV